MIPGFGFEQLDRQWCSRRGSGFAGAGRMIPSHVLTEGHPAGNPGDGRMDGCGSEKTGLDERLRAGETLALRVIVAMGVEGVTQRA